MIDTEAVGKAKEPLNQFGKRDARYIARRYVF